MDSTFDDLLRELDTTASPTKPEDPARHEAMRTLMDASKLLEKIATLLDPSDAKHPLHGASLPDASRVQLQALVKHLIAIQTQLETLEHALIEEPTPVAQEPVLAEEQASEPTAESAPIAQEPPLVEEQLAVPTPEPIPDQERATFDAYRAQWDAAFSADPSLKEKHPDVLAYYTQMETYFQEKALHQAKISTP